MLDADIVTSYDTTASTMSRHRICEMLTGVSDSAPSNVLRTLVYLTLSAAKTLMRRMSSKPESRRTLPRDGDRLPMLPLAGRVGRHRQVKGRQSVSGGNAMSWSALASGERTSIRLPVLGRPPLATCGAVPPRVVAERRPGCGSDRFGSDRPQRRTARESAAPAQAT
jgi:hypothetical protein